MCSPGSCCSWLEGFGGSAMGEAEIDLMVKAHGTLPLLAFLVGLLVWAAKTGRLPYIETVPAFWRPILVVVLGQVGGALEAAARGLPWHEGFVRGLVVSVVAVLGHHLGIEKMRGGRELGEPAVKP